MEIYLLGLTYIDWYASKEPKKNDLIVYSLSVISILNHINFLVKKSINFEVIDYLIFQDQHVKYPRVP